jgi:hypothetical protein
MKLARFGIAAALPLALAAQLSAAVVTIPVGDTHNYWMQGISDAWAMTSPQTFPGEGYDAAVVNSMDALGTPDFANPTDMVLNQFSWNNTTGKYLSMTFNYVNDDGSTDVPALVPGDLFLDSNVDGKWDYAVIGGSVAAGNRNIYQLLGDSWNYMNNANKANYVLAQDTRARDGKTWETEGEYDLGWYIRKDQPVGVAASVLADGSKAVLVGTAYFSGWMDNTADGTSTFTFGDGLNGLFEINSSQLPVVGFTVNCANDVVFEQVGDADGSGIKRLIPEPASLTIWGLAGLGVAGVAAARRRRTRPAPWSEETRSAIVSIIERGR